MKQNEIHSKLAENEARLKSEKKRLMMWSNLRLLSAFLVLVGMVYGFKNDFPLGFVLAGGALALFCYFSLVHSFTSNGKNGSKSPSFVRHTHKMLPAHQSSSWPRVQRASLL